MENNLFFIITLFTIGLLVISGCGPSIDEIQSCGNSAKLWAEHEFKDMIRDDIIEEVNQKYPELSEKERDLKVFEEMKKQISENDELIKQWEEEDYNKYCGNEKIDDNTEILTQNGFKIRVKYLWNGHTFTGMYAPEYRDSMKWIKENLPEDAIITSWWDYGHMIRGIAKRNVVIYGISKEVLELEQKTNPKYDPTNGDDLDTSNHIDFVNIAKILTNTNERDSIELMQKYNSEYLFITLEDVNKAPHFFFWADENRVAETVTDYWEIGAEKANEGSAFFYKALTKKLENFELLYSEGSVFIYKIKG